MLPAQISFALFMEKARYDCPPAVHRLLRCAGLAAVVQFSSALAQPVITDIEVGATEITLSFTDDGAANQFEVERNPGLDPNNWSSDPSENIVYLGGGRFKYTVNRSPATREFFRVAGSFLAIGLDPDGDGLPTTFEVTLGTLGNDRDTDNDGFDDGFEFASGTDPLDPNDYPPNSALPRVSFVESSMNATEGEGVLSLALETDAGSPAYNGPVQISVSTISSAAAGVDYTLGSAAMNGATGSIPVTLIDNGTISTKFRVLSLHIEDSSGNYLRGANFDTLIIIADNDVYWSGVLREGYCESNFRLRLIVTNGSPQFAFVAGSAHDGLPEPENPTGTDQSTGIIPVGAWDATGIIYTANQVTLTSPAMPVAQSSLFGSGLSLVRILEFSAVDAATDAVVTPSAVAGTYTETVSDPSGDNPHLTAQKAGTFAIVKQLPQMPPLPVLFANP